MAENSNDKRERRRVDAISQTITVYQADDRTLLGQLANFHDQGFMLIGNAEIAEDRLYRLALHFSEPIGGRSEIVVGAECLWVRETAGEQVWAGFNIIDIGDAGRALLASLAARWGNTPQEFRGPR